MKTKEYSALLWLIVCAIMVVLPLRAVPRVAARTSAPDIAQRIDAFVGEQVERHGIPGLALALVDGHQVIFTNGYGKADRTGRTVTPQTPFVLASASKPITALAIVQLVDNGQVDLDAPVQRYLPAFRVADAVASRQITVRHLLNHTSGIPEQGCQSNRFGVETLEQFVTALQPIELEAPPGARHLYCSGNYNVLGRIIEVVSGQSYASYIEQQVFTPLQMRHSYTSEQAAQQDGLAQTYGSLFGITVRTEYPYEVSQMPSGFLIASAEDLGHFLIAQLNEGRFGSASILSPAGIAAMQASGVPVDEGTDTYGLGWRMGSMDGVPTISHAGDQPGTHTLLFIEPQTRRGAVLLMNSQNMLAQFGAFPDIQNGVARLLAEQEPALTSPGLPTLYLIIDAVLCGLFALALWPVLRMRHWEQRLRQLQATGRLRLRWVSLRLVWEFGVPVTLLVGARLLLYLMGAQSWAEGFLLFSDLGAWIWAIALVMLLTGATHVVLLRRMLRRTSVHHKAASVSTVHQCSA